MAALCRRLKSGRSRDVCRSSIARLCTLRDAHCRGHERVAGIRVIPEEPARVEKRQRYDETAEQPAAHDHERQHARDRTSAIGGEQMNVVTECPADESRPSGIKVRRGVRVARDECVPDNVVDVVADATVPERAALRSFGLIASAMRSSCQCSHAWSIMLPEVRQQLAGRHWRRDSTQVREQAQRMVPIL